MALRSVHKNTVKAKIRKTGKWSGYIAPNKASPYHIVGGWHLGMKISVASEKELEDTLRDFEYYNCNYELGYRVKFWEIVK